MKKTLFSPLLGGAIALLIFWAYSLTKISQVSAGVESLSYFNTALSLLFVLTPVFLILSYIIFWPSIWAIKKIQFAQQLTEKQTWFLTYIIFFVLGLIMMTILKNYASDKIATGLLTLVCLPLGMLFNTSFYSVLSAAIEPLRKS